MATLMTSQMTIPNDIVSDKEYTKLIKPDDSLHKNSALHSSVADPDDFCPDPEPDPTFQIG
jgi:hypothetical protein